MWKIHVENFWKKMWKKSRVEKSVDKWLGGGEKRGKMSVWKKAWKISVEKYYISSCDMVSTVKRLPLRVHTFQLAIDLSILACIGWPLSCMWCLLSKGFCWKYVHLTMWLLMVECYNSFTHNVLLMVECYNSLLNESNMVLTV